MTWLAAVGAACLAALGTTGCGACYEPGARVPAIRVRAAASSPRDHGGRHRGAKRAAQRPVGAGDGAPVRRVAIGETQADEYSDTDPSALSEFKPALEGHGQWVDDATYGTVWVPSQAEVGTDFQPYETAGHWTYSDDTDYVWVSDYSWGWAPFHYGRWANVGPYGWSWIPGRVYSGAWVSWRVGPAGYGYVGWGPMAPDWYWYHGAAVGWSFGFYHPYDHYVYCPRGYLYDHQLGHYAVGGAAGRGYYEHTVPYAGAGAGRVAANPSVSGNGRVAATPTVGRRGPSPGEMGIGREAVVAPPASNQGLTQARAMATPSTATAHGAAAPFRTASAGSFNGSARSPGSTAMVPGGAARPRFVKMAALKRGSAFASRSTPVTRNPTAPSNSAPAVRSSQAYRAAGTSAPSRSFSGSSASAPRSSAPAFRSSAPSYSGRSYSSLPSPIRRHQACITPVAVAVARALRIRRVGRPAAVVGTVLVGIGGSRR